MPIHFTCAACGNAVSAPDAAGGKKGRCPKCRATVDVPTGSTRAAPIEPLDHSLLTVSAVQADPLETERAALEVERAKLEQARHELEFAIAAAARERSQARQAAAAAVAVVAPRPSPPTPGPDDERRVRAAVQTMRRLAVPFDAVVAQGSANAAAQLNRLIHENAAQGWYFSHMEKIEAWTPPPGCLGGFFGEKQRLFFVQVAIFERPE